MSGVDLQAMSKKERVSYQFRQAMYHEGQLCQEVSCACGLTMPLRFAFKCLYCGEFFCERCAEIHFGKTKAEYQAEKKAAEEKQ